MSNSIRYVVKGGTVTENKKAGYRAKDKALGTEAAIIYGTYANVAAVEADITSTVSPGSIVFCPSGIYFRGTSGGTTNNWLTVTVS